jgi:hypothetical protein
MNEQRMIELLRITSELAQLEKDVIDIDIREKAYRQTRDKIDMLRTMLAEVMNDVCPVVRMNK